MFRIRIFIPLLLVCAALAVGLLGVGSAAASHNQTMYFEAPRTLLSASARPKAIAQLKWLGVKALRVELAWHTVAPAPNSTKRPKFDATNPASYYWGQYDWLLAETQRLGWQVLLTVTSPVPKWATAGHNDRLLRTRPDPRQFKEFMTAVARHYRSQVSLYAIWNEPNNQSFLRPQFNANGSPASPRIYRALFQAGYAGLRAGGIVNPTVLMGETSPFGYDRINVRAEGPRAVLHDVAPLAFLREAMCLNTRYRKARSCAMLPVYAYGHHAYSAGKIPFYRPYESDNVTIGALSRLTSALSRAAAAHAIPAHIPIYLTEFGIQSKPNWLGVSLARQAEYDAIAEKIAWSNPHVAAFSQYLLTDDSLKMQMESGAIGFAAGLETHSGARKPLFFGFPVPLVVSKAGRGFSMWGYVRPSQGATQVRVLIQPWGSRSFRTLKVVPTDSSGYWMLRSTTRGEHWRVSWRSPSGVAYTGPPIGATPPS